MPERTEEFMRLNTIVDASMAEAESTADLVNPALAARAAALFQLMRSGAYREDLLQNLWLAFMPTSYLAYKRRKIASRREESPR